MNEPSGSRSSIWQDVDQSLWTCWKWQLRNRITTLSGLKDVINLTSKEIAGLQRGKKRLPMAITPYFASLMDPNDPECPIRRQVVPRVEESMVSKYDSDDPLCEENDSPVPGLIHRYPDRVLVITTDKCASYCRYCTRERFVGSNEAFIKDEKLDKICKYISDHKEIRDVVLSGGDPLLINLNRLEEMLKRFKAISHVEMIRLGTRVPVTLPFRVNDELVSVLKKYHPLYISLHFSHYKEITPEVQRACNLLSDNGFPLGSQTVLLKGINDNADTLKKLFHELLKIRVRPYYLYQCDLVKGTSHFRTPVSCGIEIMEKLRGHTSGYAVPSFVIDAPGGGGKVPVSPTYIIAEEKNKVLFRNYENKVFEYVSNDSDDLNSLVCQPRLDEVMI
ncbi:KamA family radical SAM protein [bacterium]|nr:KamA family radical SAM protein [bacterium]